MNHSIDIVEVPSRLVLLVTLKIIDAIHHIVADLFGSSLLSFGNDEVVNALLVDNGSFQSIGKHSCYGQFPLGFRRWCNGDNSRASHSLKLLYVGR